MSADLDERLAVRDLARELSDVDDLGCWLTLDPKARDRYEEMARVARTGSCPRDEDNTWEAGHHSGFREALALIQAAFSVYCLDCDENTIELGEYYMLKSDVWAETGVSQRRHLCVPCVEKRLGRRLRSDDFIDVPMIGMRTRRGCGRGCRAATNRRRRCRPSRKETDRDARPRHGAVGTAVEDNPLLDNVNEILRPYVEQLPITLRQIFYRPVAAYDTRRPRTPTPASARR